jgi:shikimate 5-dehydrogenase
MRKESMETQQHVAWSSETSPRPATRPTMYFIGVTTHQSSIMKIFPRWAEYLDLGEVHLQGVNFPRHDSPVNYRRLVQFIRDDPLSLGALVTTHKLSLFHAARDLFDEVDDFASLMGEVSSISKVDGRLVGHAKDPITSGLALEAFLPPDYWQRTGAQALVLGAGGSAAAITWFLLRADHGVNRPSRIIVTNRRPNRLREIESLHQQMHADVPIEYHHTPTPAETDDIMRRLKRASLIINATGLGKDAPGSPVSDSAMWPLEGIAWDFNYRGDLTFLAQARARQKERRLRIEDGWIYFVLGWTQVMAEVFHVSIPARGPRFDELSKIAASLR